MIAFQREYSSAALPFDGCRFCGSPCDYREAIEPHTLDQELHEELQTALKRFDQQPGTHHHPSHWKEIARVPGRHPHTPHIDNFFACMETRKRPNADIEEGHRSTVLCHLGNISYRLGGRKLAFDGKTDTFLDDDANKLARRTYREPWVVPESV